MLFQSDYWLAKTYLSRIETLVDFLSTDKGIKTLVIINTAAINDTRTLLETLEAQGDVPCRVDLSIGPERYSYGNEGDHTKTIYVVRSLDQTTIDMLDRWQPILAIFV